jgi:Rieske Fe-S protein
MPEQEIDKNVWVLKATPKVLETIYQGKTWSFTTRPERSSGPIRKTCPTSRIPASVPHLGCGFKWRTHKTLGQVFLCPCHLSIYDAAGKVLDGPAPRALDPLPIKVTAAGDITIIDMEFKAGTKAQVRIV